MSEAAGPKPARGPEQTAASRPTALPAASHCPTCRASWRSVVTCPRCGTDLTALMQVAVQAWTLRQATRAALCEGSRPAEALALAREACRLHQTPYAQRLLVLALLAHGDGATALPLFSQLLTEE